MFYTRLLVVISLGIVFFPFSTLANQASNPEMMIVLDGSGSMWGKLGNETKIEAARTTLGRIVPEIPPEVNIGLAAYGHNRKGDCEDIEILIPPGSTDRDALLEKALAIQPKGKTPIAGTLKQVTDQLKSREGETVVILVSDGEETCNDDPCGAVKSMRQSGIRFILNVIGFGVNELQQQELSCLAEAGGGTYYPAGDAAALLASFKQVQENIEQQVEKARTTTQKTVSKLGKLQITIPENGLLSLNELQLVRASDNKLVKRIKNPVADSSHPLLAGEYELVAGFANANYAPDSQVSFGFWTVNGGETTQVPLGVMTVSISDELSSMATGAVIVTDPEIAGFRLDIPYNNNDYYLYKPKPLPPGTYRFSVHYKRGYLYRTSEIPITLVNNVQIEAGQQGVVTINSGIRLVKPESDGLIAFELISSNPDWGPMKIETASNGDYPLWQSYGVPPGIYHLNVYLEGMSDPLPVATDLQVTPGVILEFDTGL